MNLVHCRKLTADTQKPIDSNLLSQFVDIHPGAVPYHRKGTKKTQKRRDGG